MKKIFILFLISSMSNAQVVKNIDFSIRYGKKFDSNYVQKNSNGSIEVVGDTLSAIKNLFIALEDIQNDKNDAYLVIDNSVKFINTVPDYLKKSKVWYVYLSGLKKRGYKLTKK